jgi:hypothetical protein
VSEDIENAGKKLKTYLDGKKSPKKKAASVVSIRRAKGV